MKNASDLLEEIKSYDGRPLRLMEVCGTHTNSIFRYGLRDVLPDTITLISGPGCPVCVTPTAYIDAACRLALENGCAVCAYGDMMRVPGEKMSLQGAKAAGGDIRLVYAPSDVLRLARQEPDKKFVMTAVGFETTLPLYALMLEDLLAGNIKNVRLLTAVKAIVPAMDWICRETTRVDGFLGPGHVAAIIGSASFRPIVEVYGIPVAVAGFEFEHIVAAVWDLMRQAESGRAEVHNLYPNAVREEGNTPALRLINKYFNKTASLWRGLGRIESSGYGLKPEFGDFLAADWEQNARAVDTSGCQCATVLTGMKTPGECPLLGKRCTPLNPVGPCMVSPEGACGIWYRNWGAER